MFFGLSFVAFLRSVLGSIVLLVPMFSYFPLSLSVLLPVVSLLLFHSLIKPIFHIIELFLVSLLLFLVLLFTLLFEVFSLLRFLMDLDVTLQLLLVLLYPHIRLLVFLILTFEQILQGSSSFELRRPSFLFRFLLFFLGSGANGSSNVGGSLLLVFFFFFAREAWEERFVADALVLFELWLALELDAVPLLLVLGILLRLLLLIEVVLALVDIFQVQSFLPVLSVLLFLLLLLHLLDVQHLPRPDVQLPLVLPFVFKLILRMGWSCLWDSLLLFLFLLFSFLLLRLLFLLGLAFSFLGHED
mmetsp:Transcript_245/g.252  ORF Transcript_245/g.252 Transcript_245/m.252 type:complete len:301 (+) Transcript_245:154-1056(+)